MPKIKVIRQVDKVIMVEVNFPLYLEQDYGGQEDGGSRVARIDAQGNMLMVDQNYVNDGSETATFSFTSKRLDLKRELDAYLNGSQTVEGGSLWFQSEELAFRKALTDGIYHQQKTLFAMDDAPKPEPKQPREPVKNLSLDTD